MGLIGVDCFISADEGRILLKIVFVSAKHLQFHILETRKFIFPELFKLKRLAIDSMSTRIPRKR